MRVQQPRDLLPLPHRLAVPTPADPAAAGPSSSAPSAAARPVTEVPANSLVAAVAVVARALGGTGRALSSRQLAYAYACTPGADATLALPTVEAALDLLVLEGQAGPAASVDGYETEGSLEGVMVALERPELERILGPAQLAAGEPRGEGAAEGDGKQPAGGRRPGRRKGERRRGIQPGRTYTDCLKMIVRDAPDSDATHEKPEYRYFMVFGSEKHRVLAVRSERSAHRVKYKADPTFLKDNQLGKRVSLRNQKAVQEWILSLVGKPVPKEVRRRVATERAESNAGVSSRTRTRKKRKRKGAKRSKSGKGKAAAAS